MAIVDDLVVFKAIAGRPRDIDDAVTLLALYPHIDMSRVRTRVRTLALAAEAPELERGLEQIAAAGAAALPHRLQPRRSPIRSARSKTKIGNRRPRSKSRTEKRPHKKAAPG